MLKNRKLGTKILFGIGVMLIIIIIVMSFTAWNMLGIKNDSNSLAQEHLPASEISISIERDILSAMFNMRGYGLVGNNEYLDLARESLTDVGDQIDAAKALTEQHPNLVNLKEEMTFAEEKLNEYKQLVDETVLKKEAAKIELKRFDEVAVKYMENCVAYLEGQKSKIVRDIDEGAAPSILQGRVLKINTINDLIDIFNTASVANFEAQTSGDLTLLEDTLQNFELIDEKLQVLVPITTKQEDLDHFKVIEASAHEYKNAITNILSDLKALNDLSSRRNIIANELLNIATTASREAVTQTDTVAKNTVDSITNSLLIIIIGFIVAIVFGVVINLLITRSITRSIKEITDAADKLAVGDVNVDIKSDSNDEIGMLSKSFRLMAENIREQAEAARKIAAGDKTAVVNAKSEKDILGSNLQLVYNNIHALITETKELITAAQEGKLNTKGNASAFEGAWKDLIEGINATLDACNEPIKEASKVLKEMSKGNLQINMTGDYKGDHAEIKNDLNETLEALNDVLGEIYISAEQVAVASTQVSDSSQNLSQGSSEQASSVEEITSSITQIAEQTKQNALNANKANDLTIYARDGAQQGNNQMQEMVNAMKDINESSGNISKIIKVIDEIAFQTNILALNAAVEAARAGQHGKGFAVVAEEVRNLAARSANAAKETTELIEKSIEKVEAGTQIANDTAEALEKIVIKVAEVTTIVGDIASASNEQATAISQINEGVSQVSSVTQLNTATAQQSASASEEMTNQAQLLKDMVSKFKLTNNQGASYIGNSKLYNKNNNSKEAHAGKKALDVAAMVAPKIEISLDDAEFGKY